MKKQIAYNNVETIPLRTLTAQAENGSQPGSSIVQSCRTSVERVLSSLYPRLRKVEPDVIEAFETTVGPKMALEQRAQKQLLQWIDGAHTLDNIIIRPRLYNGKLGWELYGEGIKKESANADPKQLSALPSKLTQIRDDLLLMRKSVGTDPLLALTRAMNAMGYSGCMPQIVRVGLDALKQ